MSKERHAHEDALNETEFDELLDSYWQPKTTAAERAVPYTFDDETRDVLTSFFIVSGLLRVSDEYG